MPCRAAPGTSPRPGQGTRPPGGASWSAITLPGMSHAPSGLHRRWRRSAGVTCAGAAPQIPRFAFEKFPGAKAELTTQMKSVGEAMAIGRTFQVASWPSVQAALQSVHGCACRAEFSQSCLLRSEHGRGHGHGAHLPSSFAPPHVRRGGGVAPSKCSCKAGNTSSSLHGMGEAMGAGRTFQVASRASPPCAIRRCCTASLGAPGGHPKL